MTNTPIRVLLVDDHTLFRRGLKALLAGDARFVVVGEAGDAGEAQRQAAVLQPDVILLDNHLPGVAGVDALAGLREVSPGSRVLMLTVSEDEADLAAALRGGAQGYHRRADMQCVMKEEKENGNTQDDEDAARHPGLIQGLGRIKAHDGIDTAWSFGQLLSEQILQQEKRARPCHQYDGHGIDQEVDE